MGPTNVALVKLFEADRKLRDAQARHETAAHDVRIQERRVNDLSEKSRQLQQSLMSGQSKHGQFELDLKARDEQIEKLRTQQQQAKNNKEYQALLVEINTRKVDRGKVEEQTLSTIDSVEKLKPELAASQTQLEAEKTKLAKMKAEINDKLAALQAEVDAVKPERDAAEAAVPPKPRDMFNRLADRFDGEAMAGIDRPDRRREEYLCTACNMELVRDIYNKLRSRDEVVTCPNCQRMLFIPEHFTAEHAIGPAKAARPAVKRVRATTSKGGKAVARPVRVAESADGSSAATDTAEKPGQESVYIEARATGALGKALSQAQGESVSRAVKSDVRPIDCEVHVDGRLAGIYKGISAETLERAAKYYLGEAKIAYTSLEVKRMETDTAETEAAAPAPATEPSAQATGAETTGVEASSIPASAPAPASQPTSAEAASAPQPATAPDAAATPENVETNAEAAGSPVESSADLADTRS